MITMMHSLPKYKIPQKYLGPLQYTGTQRGRGSRHPIHHLCPTIVPGSHSRDSSSSTQEGKRREKDLQYTGNRRGRGRRHRSIATSPGTV